MTKDPIKMIKDCRAKGEPFFVIRAKDMCSIAALGAYNTACYLVDANEDQQMETQNLLLEFIDYQGKNPSLVRAPDLAKSRRAIGGPLQDQQTMEKTGVEEDQSLGCIHCRHNDDKRKNLFNCNKGHFIMQSPDNLSRFCAGCVDQQT